MRIDKYVRNEDDMSDEKLIQSVILITTQF